VSEHRLIQLIVDAPDLAEFEQFSSCDRDPEHVGQHALLASRASAGQQSRGRCGQIDQVG
jgi:hypothetical protein